MHRERWPDELFFSEVLLIRLALFVLDLIQLGSKIRLSL